VFVSKLVITAILQRLKSGHNAKTQKLFARLSGFVRVVSGVILTALSTHTVNSGIRTIKTPGPYPYETPVQLPAPPPVVDSSPLPSPAPFPYSEPSPPPATASHEARAAASRHPLTAKSVREAAFKYNGVSHFCGFLAALPANVSVYDRKLGRSRALVQAGQVVRKNVVWLHRHKDLQEHKQDSLAEKR
jgi:hypothetical protein